MKTLIILGALVVAIAGAVVLVERYAAVPIEPAATSTAAANQPAKPASRPKARLNWQGGAINNRSGQVAPGGQVTQTILAGPAPETIFTVAVSQPKAKISLIAPDGKTVDPILAETVLSPETGRTVVSYPIKNNKQSGEWKVVIKSPSALPPVDYEIKTPVANPPLSVTEETPLVVTNNTGVELTLVVEETTSGLVVETVSGAIVTATVTAPDGTVTVITLAEDTGNPGTYTGEFTDTDEPGTYTVEYTITGQDSNGNQFTQTTEGQFTVTGNSSGFSASTTPGWNKKYDINRGSEVNIIGY